MQKPNRSKFPGARRPPVRQESDDPIKSHGRRGRVRKGRFSAKARDDGGHQGEQAGRGDRGARNDRAGRDDRGGESRDGRMMELEPGAEHRGKGRYETGSASDQKGRYASRGAEGARAPAGRAGRNDRAGGRGDRVDRNDRGGKSSGRGRDSRGEGSRGRFPASATEDGEIRFSDLLMQLARRAAPDLVQGFNHPEPLSRLDYALELDLKNKALQEFWTARGLPDKPNRILPSPKPRGYRTTTKRRVINLKGRFELTFMTASSAAANPRASAESLVEPPEHKTIYSFILSKLNTAAYASLAHALNYLIIRGDYTRFTVLFNVHRLNADVVRKAKLLGDHLKEMDPKTVSAFMFFDATRSDYYFEAQSSEGPWKLKKIFGPDDLHLKILDRTYAFNPTAFCQVNASILPAFLEKADQLLKPKPEYRLLDLYSGFGFFTLHLGRGYGEALGVDLGSASIESAQKMAAADPASHCKFKSGRIQVKSLEKLLPPATADKPEALLLDPPRQGTEPGVIRALASRNPARVLHIFCDLDTLPKEVNQWRKCGFMVSKVIPLDMFPGTDNLEVMVLFIPDRYGILNRIDKSKTELSEKGDEDDLLLDEKKPVHPFRADKPAPRPFGADKKGRPFRPDKPMRKSAADKPDRPFRTDIGPGESESERPQKAKRPFRSDNRSDKPPRGEGPSRPPRDARPGKPGSGPRPGSDGPDRPQRPGRKPPRRTF
ncbi:MAG: tRNA (uracil-5-)-methyltransferase family protein [Fibrobacteres bacterium]|nr:tRNA (uracil-5-)-methyltransferase family protein [Fibrobacterota bacterium]